MRLRDKLRHWWHDFYHCYGSEMAKQFAMNCHDVAEKADLGLKNASITARFRFRLHLSLCQDCHNYGEASAALKKAINKLLQSKKNPEQLKKLNKELLKRHS